jgi:hypothetical protein
MRRVGVGLALRAVVVQVALAVGVGREVRAVDCDLLAHLGESLGQTSQDGLNALRQSAVVVPELAREAVASVQAGGAAEDVLEGSVVVDQRNHSGPGG